MSAVSLALVACLGWGIADFLGGFKSRALPVITVLLVSTSCGLAAMAAIALNRGVVLQFGAHLGYAAAGGIAGLVGLICLYRGMAIGAMSIVAPISALGVLLPVTFGLVAGDLPSPWQTLGMVAALAGAVLVSREKRTLEPSPKKIADGVLLAAGAALAIGIFYVVMDRASDIDPLGASLVMRLTQFALLIPLVLVSRPCLRVGPGHWPFLIGMGVLDALAGLAYAIATAQGMLSLVAVLGSLYPAVTVLLAILVLRERPQRIQFAGVALALAGVALITL
ncbi:hypothetical protein DESUT3_13910 [Desulfuromonas versatilis]|uniref:EamA domain-containing protein n=1 Tax=Desulfuromonas versatilis TaxID=2802975 RepID=A0ABN6DW51_9BACT|nr:EamA family transporter [Desulfuromonas versatilis]BCR04322.1 hypothetical protein DESUT3_13910 [Desulfuromonas versatilis]